MRGFPACRGIMIGVIIAAIVWIAALFIIVSRGAAAPSLQAQSTYTPHPTYTPWATFTPCPSPTPSPTLYPASTPYPTQTAYPDQMCGAPNSTTVTTAAELDTVEWMDGLTLYIEAGLYETTLSPQANHVSIVSLGQVTFFGGRTEPLPYCGQTDVIQESTLLYGITIMYVEDISIIGDFVVHGYGSGGIRLTDTRDVVLDGFEIMNNGSTGPNFPGIRVWGWTDNITLNNMDIHDNGQDAIQIGGGAPTNWLVTNSKLYNTRVDPNGELWNACTHSDGVQVFGGGVSGPMTFKNVEVWNMTQGFILGQDYSGDNYAEVNDVTMRNVNVWNVTDNGVIGYGNVPSKNWLLDNVSVDATGALWNAIYLEGSGHRIMNSYMTGSRITLPDGLMEDINNCRWNATGYPLGNECER